MLNIFYFIFMMYCMNLIISGFELMKLMMFLESLNMLFMLISGLNLMLVNPILWMFFMVMATMGVVFILCLLSRLWFCDKFYL